MQDPSAIRRREGLRGWTFLAGAAESRTEGGQQRCRFTITIPRVLHDYSCLTLQMLWLQLRRRTGHGVALASRDWLTIRYTPLADTCRAGRRRASRPQRTAGGDLISKTRFQRAAAAPSALIFNVVRYGAHLCGRSVDEPSTGRRHSLEGSGGPGVDALDAHARPSLEFVGTEEGRGKMMIWSGGFRNILMGKEGVRAETRTCGQICVCKSGELLGGARFFGL